IEVRQVVIRIEDGRGLVLGDAGHPVRTGELHERLELGLGRLLVVEVEELVAHHVLDLALRLLGEALRVAPKEDLFAVADGAREKDLALAVGNDRRERRDSPPRDQLAEVRDGLRPADVLVEAEVAAASGPTASRTTCTSSGFTFAQPSGDK